MRASFLIDIFAMAFGNPRVGDRDVGVLSLTALLWFPPLLGGLVIMVAAAVVLRVTRSLRE